MKKLTRDKYLSPDEFKRICYAARTRPHVNALRDYAFILVVALAGLRVGEAIALRVGDLSDQDESTAPLLAVCAEKKRREGKALPIYDMGLPKSAARALRAYIRSLPEGARMPWSRVFPFTRQQGHNLFKHYARLAGLNPRYSIHALRHFRGVQVYEQTRDIKLCQRALRHENVKTTEVYVHLVQATQDMAAIDVEGEE
jgi:integrase/recombinase XerD